MEISRGPRPRSSVTYHVQTRRRGSDTANWRAPIKTVGALITLHRRHRFYSQKLKTFAHEFARFAHNIARFEKRAQLMVVTKHLLQLKPGVSQSRVNSYWKYSTLIIGKQFFRGLVIDPRFENGYFRNCQVSAPKPTRSLCLVLLVTTELRAMYHSAATASSSSAG